VKVRLGIGLGPAGTPAGLAAAVGRLEAAGVDSLWLPEMVYGPLAEPFVGMAYAAARTEKLKVGSGLTVLPGRHPVLVAKQLATLAGLAPKRILPVFGLQPARRAERAVFEVPPGRRGAVFDEALTLVRLLLRQQEVSFAGEFYTVAGASVGPLPPEPLDIWLGGTAPGALRRVGRLGDGWLASLQTPAEAQAGREAIQRAAAEAGRQVDPEHFGISLAVAPDGIPAELAASITARRPGADPASFIAAGWPEAGRLVEAYTAAGISKFVIRPAADPGSFDQFLEGFLRVLKPLQT
jgi:probable F420-dependent oxidoreductase